MTGGGRRNRLRNFWNSSILSTSKTMSSVSGAQNEAGLRPETGNRVARPDVALLQKAQRGDRGAYGQIVVLYQDRLYNAVLRLVGDREEARELTQEAFTRGLEKLDSFRSEASPYTWLFRIAVNLAISQLRKVQKSRMFSLDRPVRGTNGGSRFRDDDQASALMDRVARDGGESPAVRAERRERDEAVLAALGRLDAEYRARAGRCATSKGLTTSRWPKCLACRWEPSRVDSSVRSLALRDELRMYLGDKS